MGNLNKNDAAKLAHVLAFGRMPTYDDLLSYKKERCLKAARAFIIEQMLNKPKKEIALLDIPTEEKDTVADLPALVATTISKPYGSLGLDSSQEGATDSSWYLFQHQAEDFIRGKISLCMMRKLNTAIERLELALGCFKWAGIVGIQNVSEFQGYFTTALILDRDASAEMNGEKIDVEPINTEVPIGNAMLIQIRDELKRVGGLVADIYNEMPKQQTPRRNDYVVSQPQLSEILVKLNVPIGVRQIQNWEAYLHSNGLKGTQPPDGYTLETRLTLESATAWATRYAQREQSKINTKNALGETSLKTIGQRDKNLDRASGRS